MWKYEQEFRIDKPETVGEKDKHFDLDNYKDWLEEQLTNCRKQLAIQRAVGQSKQLSFTDGTMPPMGSKEFNCYHGLCECKQNCKT
jgi:hypothetical protein